MKVALGKGEPNRLDLRHPLEVGAKVVSARFSPGGRELILTCVRNETEYYLRRVPLNLSAAEEETVKRGPPSHVDAQTTRRLAR